MSVAIKQKQYFLVVGEEQTGPHTASDIQAWIRAGKVSKSSLVWAETMPDWASLSSLPEFSIPLPPPIRKAPSIPKVSVQRTAKPKPEPIKVSGKAVGIGIVPLILTALIFPNGIITIALVMLALAIPIFVLQKFNASRNVCIAVGVILLGGIGFLLFNSLSYLNDRGEVIPHRPTIENIKLGANGTVKDLLPRLAGSNGKIEWKASERDTYVYIHKPSGTSRLTFTLNSNTNFIVLSDVTVAGAACSGPDLFSQLVCIGKIGELP